MCVEGPQKTCFFENRSPKRGPETVPQKWGPEYNSLQTGGAKRAPFWGTEIGPKIAFLGALFGPRAAPPEQSDH